MGVKVVTVMYLQIFINTALWFNIVLSLKLYLLFYYIILQAALVIISGKRWVQNVELKEGKEISCQLNESRRGVVYKGKRTVKRNEHNFYKTKSCITKLLKASTCGSE